MDGAEQAGDLRLLAGIRVALEEVLRGIGDRPAVRSLVVAATRWYALSGAGEGAALAACLLATQRAGDGEPDAEADLRSILTAAREVGDRDGETRARSASGRGPSSNRRQRHRSPRACTYWANT
jgi:hypothetical protein